MGKNCKFPFEPGNPESAQMVEIGKDDNTLTATTLAAVFLNRHTSLGSTLLSFPSEPGNLAQMMEMVEDDNTLAATILAAVHYVTLPIFNSPTVAQLVPYEGGYFSYSSGQFWTILVMRPNLT